MRVRGCKDWDEGTRQMKTLRTAIITAAIVAAASLARGGELGHFNPGIPNVRDLVVPPPGWYVVLYNYGYTTDRLNDAGGNEVDSVTIRPGPGPGVTLDVDVDLDLYALSPMVIWVSPWRIGNARYAAYVAPGFVTSSLGAALNATTGRGLSGEIDSSFGVGDLFVSPIWLGWPSKHWDFALGYGFYAPTGRYEVETVTLPVVGPVKVEAEDNLGLGFWTHQIQGSAAWYPWEHRATAVVGAVTYEIHGNKEDFDINPGSHLTLNLGASQYLPLTKDQKLLAEVGLTGYSQWKITGDTGADTRNGSVLDRVHAVGAQMGVVWVPWNLSVNLRYDVEYASEARFQGEVLSLAVIFKL